MSTVTARLAAASCRSQLLPLEALLCTVKSAASVSPACEHALASSGVRGITGLAAARAQPRPGAWRHARQQSCTGPLLSRAGRCHTRHASNLPQPPPQTLAAQLRQLSANTTQSLRALGAAISRHTPTPVKQLASAALRGDFLQVSSLQARAFWGTFGAALVAGAFAVGTYYVWMGLHVAAAFVVDVTDRYVSWMLLGCAAAAGLAGYACFRQQWVVSPWQVYNLAMFKLRQDAAVAEVVGAPVAAAFPRAYIVTAGGLRFRGFWPTWRSERVHMVFPLQGRRQSGVVIVEAKKRRGKYRFLQLAVDVGGADGAAADRVVVDGASTASVSAADHLRAPLMHTLERRALFDRDDDEDDGRDAAGARELAAQRRLRQQETAPKPLDLGGGMYFYEHLYWRVYYLRRTLNQWRRRWETRHLDEK